MELNIVPITGTRYGELGKGGRAARDSLSQMCLVIGKIKRCVLDALDYMDRAVTRVILI